MTVSLVDPRPIIQLLRERQTFVLTTHMNPDGDAIGCEVALADFLRNEGKTVAIINCDPTPAVFGFLDPENSIRVCSTVRDRALLARADVIVLLDANQPNRTASLEQDIRASAAVKICIDHHPDGSPFADYTLIDEDASSTGEILYNLLTSIPGSSFSPTLASALYIAIMTDTGSFRYPRVDADVHRAVAHLLECGADPVTLYTKVYEQWSDGRIHLLGEMLAGLKLSAGGKIASVAIAGEMLRKTGTSEEDTDNFTTYPMSIAGVCVGILFLEIPGGVKISFRSRGEIPMNALAREFGGNGHKNAAGARVKGATLTDIQHHVLKAAEKYL
jgi:phosphoesterase RecJ-like protein